MVNPDKESQSLLLQAAERFKLSARAYHRVLKVARTLADLAGVEKVAPPAHRRGAELPAQFQRGLVADRVTETGCPLPRFAEIVVELMISVVEEMSHRLRDRLCV